MKMFSSSKLATLLVASLLAGGMSLSSIALRAADTPATKPADTQATKPAADLAITAADAGKTLHLTVGQTATITLTGNATTGFRWSVSAVEGAALAQLGDVQYVADAARPGLVGSGGRFVATFRAAKTGTSKVSLTYARSFEITTPPSKTFDVTITVDAPATSTAPAAK